VKVCKKCGQEKRLDEFYSYKDKNGKIYTSSPCKECRRKTADEYRKLHPQPKKPKKPRIQGFRKLPIDQRKCGICHEVKHKDNFYKNKNRASGVDSRCKKCQNSFLKQRRKEKGLELLEVRRAWRKANAEKLRQQDNLYREANREKIRVNEANRRARKKKLPDTLTEEEVLEILEVFNGKCAFCNKEAEHLDHFIPLVTGCGGTIKQNIIPLCQPMNSSKQGRNPFVWSGNCLSDEQKIKFNQTVEYLAVLNKMTVKEYEKHVYKCFENIITNI